jgi:hypothetical protein
VEHSGPKALFRQREESEDMKKWSFITLKLKKIGGTNCKKPLRMRNQFDLFFSWISYLFQSKKSLEIFLRVSNCQENETFSTNLTNTEWIPIYWDSFLRTLPLSLSLSFSFFLSFSFSLFHWNVQTLRSRQRCHLCAIQPNWVPCTVAQISKICKTEKESIEAMH